MRTPSTEQSTAGRMTPRLGPEWDFEAVAAAVVDEAAAPAAEAGDEPLDAELEELGVLLLAGWLVRVDNAAVVAVDAREEEEGVEDEERVEEVINVEGAREDEDDAGRDELEPTDLLELDAALLAEDDPEATAFLETIVNQ
ncbi:MAG: hypothetical protein MMC23_007672 [Stictis urceolatum]|nr:hypothetical protein [Stictis urceolata]